MEEHDVDIVELKEKNVFKGMNLEFAVTYEYCSNTDEFLENEDMIRANDLSLKDAYRRELGLLTSLEIKNIREKYGISQKDFAKILDWGKSTITRYENHQVQDRAHDDILRKIDSDPEWLLEFLNRTKDKLSLKAYEKYYNSINKAFNEKKNRYLIDTIHAIYAGFKEDVIKESSKKDN